MRAVDGRFRRAGRGRRQAGLRLSRGDQAWLDRAMNAWDLTSRRITRVGRIANLQAVIFDAGCVLVSRTAMSGGPRTWQATRHAGQVKLPNGETIPANVISFAATQRQRQFLRHVDAERVARGRRQPAVRARAC